MRLHEMFRNPRVSESLTFLKNSVLKAVNSSGVEVSVTPTQLSVLGGLNATADELNQAADVSAKFEVVTETNVISADENNKTFYLDAVAGFLSTLPAPALGLKYKFVVATAPTSNGYTIATNGGADLMKGMISEAEVDTTEDGPTDQNADLLTLVANVAVPGDYIELESDGTSWFFRGQTAADGGVTTATS